MRSKQYLAHVKGHMSIIIDLLLNFVAFVGLNQILNAT